MFWDLSTLFVLAVDVWLIGIEGRADLLFWDLSTLFVLVADAWLIGMERTDLLLLYV